MSITVIAEVWKALKHEIDDANLDDAAEALVNVLIDNDYETAEIKGAFRGESEVLGAIRDYNSQHEDEEEYEEEEADQEYDEDYDDDEY
jgi:hypothetical protein